MAEQQHQRLADLILVALNLAIDQKDMQVSDLLSRALDMAMTRNAGGKDFVERRDFSDDVSEALKKLGELRRSVK